MSPSPIISSKVRDENREAFQQVVTLFQAVLTDALKPGYHGETGLLVTIKDGKIIHGRKTEDRTIKLGQRPDERPRLRAAA